MTDAKTRPYLLMAVFSLFCIWPAIVLANPISMDPVSVIFSLFLEALFFALVLTKMGFRGPLILIFWFILTAITWFTLIGVPLGSIIIISLGSAAAMGGSESITLVVSAVGAELIVCVVEAAMILFLGKVKFFRDPNKAEKDPDFQTAFQIAVIGNIASVFAGLSGFVDSNLGLLVFLVIFPAVWLGKRLIGTKIPVAQEA